MVKVKVYFHDWECGQSIILYSREFGWMEYFDDYATYSPLTFKSKRDLILNTYNAPTDEEKLEMAKRESKLTYLGEL